MWISSLSGNYRKLLLCMFSAYVFNIGGFFADLFRVYLLRPEMLFLKLLVSNYWQDSRAVTAPWRHMQLRAGAIPSCPLQHTSPAPIISRVWKQGDEDRGKEVPVEDAKKEKAWKSLTQFFPGEISFLLLTKDDLHISLHCQRLEIKAEASTWAVLKVNTVISLALKILAYKIRIIFDVNASKVKLYWC